MLHKCFAMPKDETFTYNLNLKHFDFVLSFCCSMNVSDLFKYKMSRQSKADLHMGWLFCCLLSKRSENSSAGGIFHHFTQELVKHLWQSMVDGNTGGGIMCRKFQRTCSSLVRFEIHSLLFLFHPKMLLGYNIASFSPLEPWNFPIFFQRKLCHHVSHCT